MSFPLLAEELNTLTEAKRAKQRTAKILAAILKEDYRTKDDFFKLAELIKGLAGAMDKDKEARGFLGTMAKHIKMAAKEALGGK